MSEESFFADPTVESVAQRHIVSVGKLEAGEADRVIRRYREIRQALRDRLDLLPPGKFTAQRLRGAIVQVETALTAMELGLKGEMADATEIISRAGVEHLVDEIHRFDKEFEGAVIPINVDVAALVTDNANFLINRYDASLEAYTSDIRAGIVREMSQAAIEEIGLSELTSRIGKFFLGEEWKIQRIARTELHHAYGGAKQRTMEFLVEDQIPDLKKALIHPMDARTAADSKALALENPIVPVDQPFVFKWGKEKRIFMFPPDRPNDRSIMVPYREGWAR